MQAIKLKVGDALTLQAFLATLAELGSLVVGMPEISQVGQIFVEQPAQATNRLREIIQKSDVFYKRYETIRGELLELYLADPRRKTVDSARNSVDKPKNSANTVDSAQNPVDKPKNSANLENDLKWENTYLTPEALEPILEIFQYPSKAKSVKNQMETSLSEYPQSRVIHQNNDDLRDDLRIQMLAKFYYWVRTLIR